MCDWQVAGWAEWQVRPQSKRWRWRCHGHTGGRANAAVYIVTRPGDNVKAVTWRDRAVRTRRLMKLFGFLCKSLRSFPLALEYYWCHFSLVCSAWFEVLSWLDMIILGLFAGRGESTLWGQTPRNAADFQGTSLYAPKVLRLRTIMKMNGKLSLRLNRSFC